MKREYRFLLSINRAHTRTQRRYKYQIIPYYHHHHPCAITPACTLETNEWTEFNPNWIFLRRIADRNFIFHFSNSRINCIYHDTVRIKILLLAARENGKGGARPIRVNLSWPGWSRGRAKHMEHRWASVRVRNVSWNGGGRREGGGGGEGAARAASVGPPRLASYRSQNRLA